MEIQREVRITLDSAVVESDSAVFKFRDKQLARGDLRCSSLVRGQQSEARKRLGAARIKLFTTTLRARCI